ncbi:DUF1738 domain-containing protein [archaeon]|nr:DUF1738 domain-containing protein [archaeon]
MDFKKTWKKKDNRDYQQELTDKFILRLQEAEQNLDKGLKWEKPFFTCNELPINYNTKEKYKGGNIITLLSAEYPDPRWLTFNQMLEISKKLETPLKLKKGSKAEYIMKVVPSYEKNIDGTTKKDANGILVPLLNADGKKKIGYKYYPVFNASCVEGLEPYLKLDKSDVKPFEIIELLSKALQEKTELKIEHTSKSAAFYSPKHHMVHMPDIEYFKSSNDYSDVLLHEFGHSTGPALGRNLTGKFGTLDYAKEELVAELISSFMSIELGIPHNPSSHENHSAYLKSWISVLKNDKTLITKASNQASKATQYQIDHFNAYTIEQNLINTTIEQPELSNKKRMKM